MYAVAIVDVRDEPIFWTDADTGAWVQAPCEVFETVREAIDEARAELTELRESGLDYIEDDFRVVNLETNEQFRIDRG